MKKKDLVELLNQFPEDIEVVVYDRFDEEWAPFFTLEFYNNKIYLEAN